MRSAPLVSRRKENVTYICSRKEKRGREGDSIELTKSFEDDEDNGQQNNSESSKHYLNHHKFQSSTITTIWRLPPMFREVEFDFLQLMKTFMNQQQTSHFCYHLANVQLSSHHERLKVIQWLSRCKLKYKSIIIKSTS